MLKFVRYGCHVVAALLVLLAVQANAERECMWAIAYLALAWLVFVAGYIFQALLNLILMGVEHGESQAGLVENLSKFTILLGSISSDKTKASPPRPSVRPP
jgi:hypothetical protein